MSRDGAGEVAALAERVDALGLGVAAMAHRVTALEATVARQGRLLEEVVVFLGQREMGPIYAGALLRKLHADGGGDPEDEL